MIVDGSEKRLARHFIVETKPRSSSFFNLRLKITF